MFWYIVCCMLDSGCRRGKHCPIMLQQNARYNTHCCIVANCCYYTHYMHVQYQEHTASLPSTRSCEQMNFLRLQIFQDDLQGAAWPMGLLSAASPGTACQQMCDKSLCLDIVLMSWQSGVCRQHSVDHQAYETWFSAEAFITS